MDRVLTKIKKEEKGFCEIGCNESIWHLSVVYIKNEDE